MVKVTINSSTARSSRMEHVLQNLALLVDDVDYKRINLYVLNADIPNVEKHLNNHTSLQTPTDKIWIIGEARFCLIPIDYDV